MYHILLIERSATYRHAIKKQLTKNKFEVTVADTFEYGLEKLNDLIIGSIKCDGVVVGWPERTDQLADEVLVFLANKQLENIPKLILSEDGDPARLDWITNNPRAAVLPWSEHIKTSDTVIELIELTDNIAVRTRDDNLTEQPIRIMFVDDSPSSRFTFRNILESKGYYVETAASVDEGMELAINSTFDIAIIDYYMPGGNGDTLVRNLKQDVRTNTIVNCIVTATYSDHVIKDCLNAGAVECMFKNESHDLFLTRVESVARAVLDRRSIESERRYLKSILSSVGDGVYGVDKNGEIEFVNQSVCRSLGYASPSSLVGKSAHALFHYAAEDGKEILKSKCPLNRCYQNGGYLTNWRTVFWDRSGMAVDVECTIFPIVIDNTFEGSVVAFRNISDKKSFEEQLCWQTTHDAVTKLPNRSYFEDQLEHEVNRIKRTDECSAVLFIDLDRFKYINDTAGHAVGDQILVDVSQRLKERLRSADILARISGDEFGVILRNAGKSNDEIYKTADAFRSVLEENDFYCAGKAYSVTITIGVHILDNQTRSAGEAMSNADIACHIAKSKGRNQTHIFSKEYDDKSTMDMELGWSSRLRKALRDDLFILTYQPILALNVVNGYGEMAYSNGDYDKNIWGENQFNYEVLIRLKDSNDDVILPNAFLPTAERFDLIREIDMWVIDNAFRTLSEQLKMGNKIHFSINLSAQSLVEGNFTEFVKEKFATYKINPRHVTFEITETGAVTNIKAAKELIAELRALGCYFALDDFGSGFSSFGHLKHLDVDVIKIDGQFIRGVADNPVDRAVILAITKIAHTLGKHTVAEYVDSMDTLNALASAGVDYVQGFHIGKPFFELDEAITTSMSAVSCNTTANNSKVSTH